MFLSRTSWSKPSRYSLLEDNPLYAKDNNGLWPLASSPAPSYLLHVPASPPERRGSQWRQPGMLPPLLAKAYSPLRPTCTSSFRKLSLASHILFLPAATLTPVLQICNHGAKLQCLLTGLASPFYQSPRQCPILLR